MRRIVVAAALLAAGATGGVVVATAASGAGSPGQVVGTRDGYPVNSAGLTYGSISQSTSPDAEPDLVQAVSASGTQGYVYSKDTRPALPANPAQALAQQVVPSNSVPLYALDGKTVLGSFQLVSSVVAAAPHS